MPGRPTLGSVVGKAGFKGSLGIFAGLGLLSNIPVANILTSLATSGYQYEYLKAAVREDDPELPGWDDKGGLLETGFKVSLASFVWMLPVGLLFGIAIAVLISGYLMASPPSGGEMPDLTALAASPAFLAGLLAIVVAGILALVWGAFLNALLLNGVMTGELAGFFEWKESFSVRYASSKGEYWTGFWGSFGYIFLGGMAFSLISLPVSFFAESSDNGLASFALGLASSALGLAVMLPFMLVAVSRWVPYLRKAYAVGVQPAAYPPAPPVSYAPTAPGTEGFVPAPPLPPVLGD